MDETPYLYSISLEHPNPTIMLLEDWITDPVVTTVALRKLKKPLHGEAEDAFKELLTKYEEVEHKTLFTRITDIRDGHVGSMDNGLGDTELVQKILQDAGMMEKNTSSRVTTHFFLPGRGEMLDMYYKNSLTPLVYKNYSTDQKKTLLAKQIGLFVDLLV
jgi:hypothetical protein